MVQSFDYNSFRPNYNAVKINIKKPEVNVGNNQNTYMDDNGIYSAVNIEIDNPTVNTEPKRIYDYPIAESPVTYDMLNQNKLPLPQGFNVAYTTTNVILPKMEQEVEMNDEEEIANSEANTQIEETGTDEITVTEPVITEDVAEETSEEVADVPNDVEVENTEETEGVDIPAPNYTTVEDEKGEEIKATTTDVAETEEINVPEIKKPEIIPGEEILPDVDIPLVISNLTSTDYDTQAQQMEEIARIALDNKENAVPYIVREVFTSLIDITNKDTSDLAAPTEKQVEARKKLITNFIVIENSKNNNKEPKLPYQLTEDDFIAANELSPMEMAERNKEYALYTMAILAKIYTDEVEKQTGNVVPLTDLPGSAAIVDALRQNPNAGVKIAAIDALSHIQRPEYNEELNTLFELAKNDANPQVAQAAERALERTNNQ